MLLWRFMLAIAWKNPNNISMLMCIHSEILLCISLIKYTSPEYIYDGVKAQWGPNIKLKKIKITQTLFSPQSSISSETTIAVTQARHRCLIISGYGLCVVVFATLFCDTAGFRRFISEMQAYHASCQNFFDNSCTVGAIIVIHHQEHGFGIFHYDFFLSSGIYIAATNMFIKTSMSK